jgi:DNA-binding LacI/PurR family transcriptional regulator
MIRYNPIDIMAQIAQDTGFSYADVIGVFYGETLDRDKQNRILQSAKALDYSERMVRRSARPGIGLITSGWPTSDYSGNLLQGILSAADTLGYDLTVHIQNTDIAETLDRHFRTLFELGYAEQGFFMLTHDYFQISSSYCQKYARPYVLGDCDANESIVTQQPSIGIDNRRAMMEVMRYILHMGHRRIGFISGPSSIPSAYWRLQGYLDGLAEAGLPVDESLIVEADYRFYPAEDLTSTLMQQTPSPTAIVSANDLMALGAMAALGQMKYRIPTDVSLTGFDDIDMAVSVTPQLTTVRQPLIDMGRVAVEMLDQMIRCTELEDSHRIFETELVIRDSVQAVSNN